MHFMDCHCHLGVDVHLNDPVELVKKLRLEPRAATDGFFNIMSTNHIDIDYLMAMVEIDQDNRIIPFFGIHPWYAHLFSTKRDLGKLAHYTEVLGDVPEKLMEILPEPIYLDDQLQKIRKYALRCETLQRPYAIGEIGLDKLFRVPTNGYYGNQEHKSEVSLTTAKVLMAHQKHIFLRQLELADELKKPVSVHCVKAHGPLYDLLATAFLDIPAVTLHSYTGSSDLAKRWATQFSKQKRGLYFSLSNIINGEESKRVAMAEILKVISQKQILYETDMPIDRYFLHGREDEYFELLHEIQERIREILEITDIDCNAVVHRNCVALHQL